MYRPALVAGVAFAFIGVVLGAFGAHALKAMLSPDQLNVFNTAVRYQFYHSIALVLSGMLYRSFPYKVVRLASALFTLGIILFSGSLYLMNFLSIIRLGLGPVGIITPIGGLFFMAGWILLLAGILKKEAA